MLGREALERLKLGPVDLPLLHLDNDVVSFCRLRHDVGAIAVNRVRKLEVAFDSGPDCVAVVEKLQRLEKDRAIVVVVWDRLVLGVHRTPAGGGDVLMMIIRQDESGCNPGVELGSSSARSAGVDILPRSGGSADVELQGRALRAAVSMISNDVEPGSGGS